MKKGTRRSDIKGRLTPRRLSWFGWLWGRVLHFGKILVLAAILVVGLVWVWSDGHVNRVGQYLQGKIALAASDMAGMTVGDVIVEGRHHIDTRTLKKAIDVEPGVPMLGVDIKAMHARLTSISWVKDVQVRRALPDRIIVTITERIPIAVWSDAAGGPALIDDEGVVLTHEEIADYGPMLAVEGKGCEQEAGLLIALLKGQPDVAVRVKKAIRVSGRRWDLVLEGGMIVKLPEDDPGFALARAAKAQLQEKVFDQDLRVIDMRQTDRIILEGKPGVTRDLLLKGGNPV